MILYRAMMKMLMMTGSIGWPKFSNSGLPRATVSMSSHWYVSLAEAISSSANWSKVAWCYWPDDLRKARDSNDLHPKAADGRRAYHGHHELIASNHLDVIDVLTIARPVEVQYFEDGDGDDDDDGSPKTELYWRQYFDIRDNTLSVSSSYRLRDDVDHRLETDHFPGPEKGMWLWTTCQPGRAVAPVSQQDVQDMEPCILPYR